MTEATMPSDPRKRQKKLERRTARRKQKRHGLARAQSSGLPGQLSAASKFPVLHCWISQSLEAQGMGAVLLSREFQGGQVAVATFLVDRYCLGVKDTWAEVLHRTAYDDKYLRKMTADVPQRSASPAEARKLVEQAVEYARGLGLTPHPDYAKALLLFGDIDPSQSDASFEFGKDGKPLFIAGPEDSPEFCRKILAILTNHCGPGGFEYVIPFGDEFLDEMPEDYLEDDEEENERP
jgi:hypothetical protein